MNYWMSSVWHRRGSNWRLKTLIENNFAVHRWPGQGMLASDWSLGCDTGLWLVNDRGWGEPLPNWGTASWFTELRRSLMQSVLYSKQYFKNTLIDCIIVSFLIMSNIYFIQATVRLFVRLAKLQKLFGFVFFQSFISLKSKKMFIWHCT